jgi:hypothetical protein
MVRLTRRSLPWRRFWLSTFGTYRTIAGRLSRRSTAAQSALRGSRTPEFRVVSYRGLPGVVIAGRAARTSKGSSRVTRDLTRGGAAGLGRDRAYGYISRQITVAKPIAIPEIAPAILRPDGRDHSAPSNQAVPAAKKMPNSSPTSG